MLIAIICLILISVYLSNRYVSFLVKENIEYLLYIFITKKDSNLVKLLEVKKEEDLIIEIKKNISKINQDLKNKNNINLDCILMIKYNLVNIK